MAGLPAPVPVKALTSIVATNPVVFAESFPTNRIVKGRPLMEFDNFNYLDAKSPKLSNIT